MAAYKADDDEVSTEYCELSKHTRRFLSSLREEDTKLVWEAIMFIVAVRRVLRFVVWMIVTVVGSFITGAVFIEQWGKLKTWLGNVLR